MGRIKKDSKNELENIEVDQKGAKLASFLPFQVER